MSESKKVKEEEQVEAESKYSGAIRVAKAAGEIVLSGVAIGGSMALVGFGLNKLFPGRSTPRTED